MDVIIPTIVTDSNLTSSNAPLIGNEIGAVPWTIGGTFALNAYATGNDKLYKSIQAANTGHALSDAAWWLDMGVLNKKAMFDTTVGTKTTATNNLTVVFAADKIDSLALLNVSATSATVKVTSGGVTMYDKTFSMVDTRGVVDTYTYWFSDIVKRSKLTLTDLPPFTNGVLTVTLTAVGEVSCGVCVIGKKFFLGDVVMGASPDLVDYSKTTIDQYGAGTYTAGNYASNIEVMMYVKNVNLDFLYTQMIKIRATRCVWIGGGDRYDCLTTYGVYSQFKPVIKGFEYTDLSMQVKGQI